MKKSILALTALFALTACSATPSSKDTPNLEKPKTFKDLVSGKTITGQGRFSENGENYFTKASASAAIVTQGIKEFTANSAIYTNSDASITYTFSEADTDGLKVQQNTGTVSDKLAYVKPGAGFTTHTGNQALFESDETKPAGWFNSDSTIYTLSTGKKFFFTTGVFESGAFDETYIADNGDKAMFHNLNSSKDPKTINLSLDGNSGLRHEIRPRP